MLAKKCVLLNISFLFIIFFLVSLIEIASSQEFVVLKVILNEEDKGEFFLILAPDNDIWIKRDELDKIGLKEGLGEDIEFAQETYVSLKSIPALKFQINEEEVSLKITAPPQLFKEQDIDISYKKPYKVTYTKDVSSFLNYALTYDYKTEEPFLNVSGEFGVSIGDYLGMSTFAFEKTEDRKDAVRLMTNLTVNNREKLRTAIFGDFLASGGVLGSGLVLGGINLSKNFSIDPYLLRYPSLNLSGIIETPSDVEVYLDDMLITKERLSPGNFLFNEVPATIGFGTAKIVIKDAYGRERAISAPYYYTDKLLKRGFQEYSYSIGFVREDFGTKSSSYGNLALLGFHHFGFSDSLKIGYAVEASKDLINGGPTASLLISNTGILDTAFAVSNSMGKSGFSGFLGYSFQSKNLSAIISSRFNSEEYSNLAVKPYDDKARFQFISAVGVGGKSMGFITGEYSSSKMYTDVKTSRAALSYNRAITKWTTFFITLSETKDTEINDEIFAGLHVNLGKNISSNINYTGTEGSETKKISLDKSLPVGTGFGYKAEVENSGEKNNIEGGIQHQNSYGIYEVEFSNKTRDNGYGYSLSGGVGYIENSIFLSRPITDSFAKVKVDKLEGVRVYYYGNEAGRTDRSGESIIPSMHSFQDNRIDIEYRDIPINYTISSLTQYVSPSLRSGSVVKFDVQRLQGFVGTVYVLDKGEKISIESAIILIQIKDKTIEGLAGRDGEFYLENIPSGKHQAKILYSGKECKFGIIIPESEEIMVDLGEVVCEVE